MRWRKGPAAPELTRLREELEQRNRELTALAEINRAIAEASVEGNAGVARASLRPDPGAEVALPRQVLERIVEEAGKLVGADGAGIAFLRPDENELEVGPDVGALSTIPPRRLPLQGSITGRAVRTGVAQVIADVTQDPDWFPLDEPTHPGSAIAVPLRAGSGTIGGLVVVRSADHPPFGNDERDVLQRFADQAAIAIQQARLVRRLEDENRRKEEFVSTLSHEMRTPLAGILLWNDILRADPAAAALGASAEAFPVITQSAEMLLTMMNHLLDLGRIEAGKLNLERRLTDLRAIARQALVAFPRGDEESGVMLIDGLPESLPAVNIDPVRIQQVVSNLLSNAVKFTDPPGQITLRAELSADGGRVAVSVEDTGVGIPVDMIGIIFERFRQGGDSPSSRRGGLGIGLTLARALVEAHGGTICVESTVGEGSTFTFELPVATEAEMRAALEAPTSEEEGLKAESGDGRAPDGAGGRARTVLVAEDVAETRQALSTVLTARGYRVLEAPDGEAAVRVARAELPDAILMDVAMPRLDGISALEQLRGHDPTAAIPVAAVTARAMPDDRRRIEAAGFDAYLVKPFRIPELVATLERLLADHKTPA